MKKIEVLEHQLAAIKQFEKGLDDFFWEYSLRRRSDARRKDEHLAQIIDTISENLKFLKMIITLRLFRYKKYRVYKPENWRTK